MKIIISLLTLLAVQITYSQTEKEERQYIYVGNSMLNVGYGSLSLKAPSKGDTQGSMYLYDQFSAVKAGGVLQEFLGRYNAYEDRMEFKSGDKIYEYFPNIHDKEFTIINLNKTYIYLTYFLDEIRSENGYLVFLQKGEKYTLYEKERIKLQEGRVSQTGYDKTVPDKYIPVKNEFYIGMEDKIMRIPKSKKDFTKLFGSKEKEVSDFLKKNKYSLKNESDLRLIINYLNRNI